MATQSGEEEDDKLRALEGEISELRTAEKELFEQTRPVNEKLESISKRKRECIDELHRLTAEKHDREKQHETIQRLIELETDMKRVKCENEALKREKETLKRTNSKCTVTINNLKQSLDEAAKHSRSQMRTITELNEKISEMQQSRSADIPTKSRTGNDGKVTELQEQLHKTNELLSKTSDELNETRQRLLEVQEQLIAAEQLTAITQHRALREFDNSEQLQLELTPQLQPTGRTG